MEFPVFGNIYNKSGVECLPHRPPFLFVDTLISADETGALGEYTFTEEKNSFFKGHFPDYPVVPGVVLVEAMAQVAGAALDVFENEPFEAESKFRTLDNVILTPHIAWRSHEAMRDLKIEVTGNIIDFFEGRPLKNQLNLK